MICLGLGLEVGLVFIEEASEFLQTLLAHKNTPAEA